jgi:3-phenylpropionate/trans-cinnamate dioxygenase ferredoxin subunit
MSFQRACSVADVADGSAVAVEVDGVAVAVVREGDDWYAVYDECSHAAVPLSEGDVEGAEIECWLPATEPVAIYPVQVEGDDVLIDVRAPY